MHWNVLLPTGPRRHGQQIQLLDAGIGDGQTADGGRAAVDENVAAGVVGAGFGFRTVARELLDVVPVAGWALKGAIAYCEEVRDYISRDLFARILASEEEHVDTLERQFEMIERMGIHNYIQLNSISEHDSPKSGAAPYLKG